MFFPKLREWKSGINPPRLQLFLHSWAGLQGWALSAGILEGVGALKLSTLQGRVWGFEVGVFVHVGGELCPASPSLPAALPKGPKAPRRSRNGSAPSPGGRKRWEGVGKVEKHPG